MREDGFLLGALRGLIRRIPVARGRADKELAQAIGPPLDQVARLVTFRGGQSRFRHLLSVASGKDRARETHIQRGVVLGQQALGVRLDDLRQRGAALDVDVARIAGHLRTVRLDMADTRRAVRATAIGLADLADETVLLAELLDECERRLDEVDTRLDRQDARLTRIECHELGTNGLDVAVTRWADGETYTDLPFVGAVVLLAAEVAAGPCGQYELLREATDGPSADDNAAARYFRRQLIRRVVEHARPKLWTTPSTTLDLLMSAGDIEPTDGDVVAEILGARLRPTLATPHGAFATALARVLDIAAERPVITADAQDAIDRARTECGPMPIRLDGAEFVEHAIGAVFRAELRGRRRLTTGPDRRPDERDPMSGPSGGGRATSRDRIRRIAETARTTADSVTPANLPADPANGPRGLRDPLTAFREQDTPDPRREPVALVLAGGGARGAYQAGVVRYLADVGTPVIAIAGASIGAINGAVLASAPSLADGARRLRELWREVAAQTGEAPVPGDPADPATRIANLPHHLGGPMLRRGFLDRLVTDHVDVSALRNGIPTLVSVFPSIDPYLDPTFVDRQLHGPLRARGLRLGWAVDCVRGYVLRHRSEWIRINELAPDAVHHAVLASAALPILLPPRAVGGRAYRDGGLGGRFADNVPVGALCDVVGCDRVVVVHLEPLPLVNPNEYPGLDIIEVMPSRSLGTSGPSGWLTSLLDLSPSRVAELDELGYADARQLLGDRWEREAAGQVFRFMAEFRHDAVAELDEPVDG